MTAHDMAWHAGGAALLLGAISTGFAIRPLSQATSVSELALGLGGFCLACFGVLLLTRGRGLRDAWHASLNAQAQDQPPAEPIPENIRSLLAWDAAMGGRASLATYLILRAQQQSTEPRRRRKPPRPITAVANLRLPKEHLSRDRI